MENPWRVRLAYATPDEASTLARHLRGREEWRWLEIDIDSDPTSVLAPAENWDAARKLLNDLRTESGELELDIERDALEEWDESERAWRNRGSSGTGIDWIDAILEALNRW